MPGDAGIRGRLQAMLTEADLHALRGIIRRNGYADVIAAIADPYVC